MRMVLNSMGLFNRKKKKPMFGGNKFVLDEFVYFRYRDELVFVWVKDMNKNTDGKFIYDVQLGGQCPSLVKNVKEELLIKKIMFEK